MSARLNPYLSFDGAARAAMDFYRSVFGGTLEVTTFGDFGSPTGTELDAETAAKVMHSALETPEDFLLMAGDVPPGMPYQPGGSMSISLSGDNDSLRGYFTALADGGAVLVPFERQMWGDEFGMCVDRFGVTWMVNVTAPA